MMKEEQSDFYVLKEQNFRRKRRKRDGIFVSTTLCIGFVAIFLFLFMIIAALTYSVTYDIFLIDVDVGKKNETEPKLLPKFMRPSVKGFEDVDYRLPTNLVPIQYVVKLQPFLDPAVNYTIIGYEEITFSCASPTNQVIFHSKDIAIDILSMKIFSIDGSSSSSLVFTSFDYDPELQFFTGTVNELLEEGVSYNMTMNFTGYLNDNLGGFYRSTYVNTEGNETLLAVTQFEATDARKAFPCFDEPALKARFEIHILREGTERRSISNMPRENTFEAEDPWKGWYWDVFENSLPMSTYLVAVVLSDFVYNISDANDHVTFRVWAQEGVLGQTDYALETGPEVLTYYEKYFAIDFPLPKQDMAAIPDFSAGAMENWGLITYRESDILFDPVRGGASNKQRVGEVIAHELAHQWFGDLVSPSWWTYIWLNEGFASFMQAYGLNDSEPTFGMLDQFILANNQEALAVDALDSSHPISVNVTNPEEIGQLFDSISYSKGAAIIRMMEFFLTTPTFQAGITNYLTNLSYSSATQDDLWRFLTEQGHVDHTLPIDMTVKQIMDTWTLQMGYPLITIIRSEQGSEANVSQERFLLGNTSDTHNYMWWVPITFSTEDNADFSNTYPTNYLSDQETEITVDVQVPSRKWVIFNNMAGSYYRVNYDYDNWQLIIQQLLRDKSGIELTNRAQILDDSLNLAKGGVLSYDVALDLTNYLEFETEYVPWVSALTNLGYLEEMFTRTAGYGAMKDYLSTMLKPIYISTGFDDSLNDPHLEQLTRDMVTGWMCHLDYEPCVLNSTFLFSQWMNFPDEPTVISPNLKSTVYCTGIAEGDVVEWDFAYEQYLQTNLATDKNYLLRALGCSKEIWILERYLDMTFTEQYGIRKQDAYMAFDSVSNNDIGRDLAWDYLRENWDAIAAYYGSPTACSDFALVATEEFNTQQELDELIDLKAEHIDELGTATQSIDQAIETVQNNIDWMSLYYTQINGILMSEGYGDR